ncbi:AsnC family protein [Vibrio chagasii]|nr:AsnC family protein [Vibrio chagasii]
MKTKAWINLICQILDILKTNARCSVSDIAREVSLSSFGGECEN